MSLSKAHEKRAKRIARRNIWEIDQPYLLFQFACHLSLLDPVRHLFLSREGFGVFFDFFFSFFDSLFGGSPSFSGGLSNKSGVCEIEDLVILGSKNLWSCRKSGNKILSAVCDIYKRKSGKPKISHKNSASSIAFPCSFLSEK